MLEFNVKNQIIERTDSFSVVADSRTYLSAEFAFSEDWTGEIRAVFGNDGKFYDVLLTDGSCMVPWEVIKPPFFTVSVFCGEESLVTANVVKVDVEKSGMENGEVPSTPTPTVWQQYIASMQEVIDSGLPYIGENGNWFLYNAEEGTYKDTGVSAIGPKGEQGIQGVPGEKGDKGDRGEKGEQGPKGDTGYTPQWKKLADITTAEEVNSIIFTDEEFPDISKCKEFIVRAVFPKSTTGEKISLGAIFCQLNNTSTAAYRFSSTNLDPSYISENRTHIIIADGLIYSVGTQANPGQASVMTPCYTLIGDRFVNGDVTSIIYRLNESSNNYPVGTRLIVYGKVEANESL